MFRASCNHVDEYEDRRDTELRGENLSLAAPEDGTNLVQKQPKLSVRPEAAFASSMKRLASDSARYGRRARCPMFSAQQSFHSPANAGCPCRDRPRGIRGGHHVFGQGEPHTCDHLNGDQQFGGWQPSREMAGVLGLLQ